MRCPKYIVQLVMSIGAAFLLLVGSALAKQVDLNAISFRVVDGKTVIEVEISQPTGFSVAASASPYRVIVDFGAINFNFASVAGPKTAGLVTAWRAATVATDHGRLMLETSGPVQIFSSRLIPGLGKRPAHIQIEIAKVMPPPIPVAPAFSTG